MHWSGSLLYCPVLVDRQAPTPTDDFLFYDKLRRVTIGPAGYLYFARHRLFSRASHLLFWDCAILQLLHPPWVYDFIVNLTGFWFEKPHPWPEC